LKSVLFKTLIYYVNHNQCIQQSSDSESLNQGEFYKIKIIFRYCN